MGRWLGILGALLLPLVLAAQGRAQPIATGPGGELSVWRVLEEGRRTPTDEALAALDPDECDDCRALGQASARLDLREGTRRGTRFVALGVVLETERATTAHLFMGVDGAVQVLVDGEPKASWNGTRVIDDEQHLALPLSAGRHRLVLAVNAPRRGDWRIGARLMNEALAPGVAPATIDLGDEPLSAEALAELRQATIRVREVVSLAPPTLRARVGLPGGGPSAPVAVRRDGSQVTRAPLRGVWRGETTSVFALPESLPRRGGLGTLTVDGTEREVGRELARHRELLRWGRALAALEPPEASASPIGWRLDEIRRVLNRGERDGRWVRWLEREARRLTRALARGDDPFGEPSGYVRMAHRSRLDGSDQPYELFVPTNRRGRDRRDGWPLVVTLHGFKGNAGDYFRNTFGLPRNYAAGESLLAHGRHGTAPTEGPMVVIAPQGRGQAMYRHAGEVDILEAIADVRARLPIDPTRIYITGGSMGGTGAAYLPLRNPDLFAAAAPLAGYHDQRVRQDTHQAGLTAVERFLMARLSDVDWAENAAHLPMLLVRGQRDRPLEWTRNLVGRLRALDYEVEHREPPLRHNVWTATYAEGAIFDWFGSHRRPTTPRRVRLRTARERTRQAWWVEVQRERADAFGEVDARIDEGRIVARTEGLARVVFSPPAALLEGDELTAEVDGQTLRGSRPLVLTREGGEWRVGGHTPAPLGRPLRDVYHDRLVFVVGTQDPGHTAMNRRVARHWARPRGWDVRYPIVDDVDVSAAMREHATLVLLGPPRSNALLAPIAGELPIRFTEDAVLFDGQRFEGSEVGAVFRATWPGTERALLVIAGPTPLGTWRSRFLPEVLAEYAIFDEQVENARGEMTCGGVKRDRVTGAGVGATANDTRHGAVPVDCAFRAHGFFD